MVCVACSKTAKENESNDCFENALETIKQHYNFYKNSIRKRDLELLQLNQRNEELIKALELLQKPQPTAAKRFKANEAETSWLTPNENKRNVSKDDSLSEISITDDDEVAAGASNLNIALNSEQLFETSVVSPTTNVSCSEMIVSPRTKDSLRRNQQRDEQRKGYKNKMLQKSKSEWPIRERSSPTDKSWGTKFVQPALRVSKVTENHMEIKKSEKKVNLSLKKANPSKIKQSLLNFNSSKNVGTIESDVAEEIIDASPVVLNKNSRAGRSWVQRSDHSASSDHNSPILADEENNQKPEHNCSIPIENIVFDFSPSKKSENPQHAETTLITKLSSKQLNFDQVPNEKIMECSGQSESSSVVILTPATQDIIFVDDTCNEDDTLDLLAEVMKVDNTENLKKLKHYETKKIEELKRCKQTKNDILSFIKPVAAIKTEKTTQKTMEESYSKLANDMNNTLHSNQENKPINPILNEEDDDDDEDDEMPRPLKIKDEPKRRLTILERLNIKCDDCEKYVNFFGDRLSDTELAKHINQCTRHKQPNDLVHNTPEDFWNPFILSFADNDPRNEVLMDKRQKARKEI